MPAGVTPPEQIEVANIPAPASPAPVLTAAQQLAAEYELPNSDFDPDQLRVTLPGPAVTKPTVPQPVPVPPTEPAAPSKPQHSPRTLRLAEKFGISKAEIDASDPEVLAESIALMTSQALDERQRLISLQPQRGQPGAEPAAPAPAPTPEFDLGLTAEEVAEFDPRFLSVLKKMGAEITALKGQLSGVNQREQQRAAETYRQRCDRSFQKFEGILGKGTYEELDPQGAEVSRRIAVLGEVQRNSAKIPFETKIAQAVAKLFPGAAPAPETANPPAPGTKASAALPETVLPRNEAGQITGSRIPVDAWNGSATLKPSQRATPAAPPGKERAVAAVTEAMKTTDFFTQSGPNGTPVVSDEDTLPD